jgi:alkylation response protein AidB-like acyl-CoA dehydrogenase
MLEGTRVNRISVRGAAVASATAVTAIGSVLGVAHANEGTTQTQPQQSTDVAGSTLLADIPAGAEAQTISDNIGLQAQAQQSAADAAAQKAAAEAARQKAAAVAHAKAAAAKAAADAAAAKAAAAQKAAEAAALARAQLTQDYSQSDLRNLVDSIVGNAAQAQCFSNIVTRESGWNVQATNPYSGAYGLVQALPGDKMASVGADWRTNPVTQIKWGLSYMNSRYGSPCDAWAYWQVHSAY